MTAITGAEIGNFNDFPEPDRKAASTRLTLDAITAATNRKASRAAWEAKTGARMTTGLTIADAFEPYGALASTLVAHATEGDDGSHDIAHILRVFKNAMRIQAKDGGDGRILTAAVLLHDCVAVEKNSPMRHHASALAAKKASTILAHLGWSSEDIAAVAHAVLTHSFSANIPPDTIEAKILQDADRLDAIGMIGAARCFYIAGRLGSSLYDPFDASANSRALDDKRFAIDHFQTKLFKLADQFQTASGRQLARERHERLQAVLAMFLDEI